mgnify:CR=1 FL=1
MISKEEFIKPKPIPKRHTLTSSDCQTSIGTLELSKELETHHLAKQKKINLPYSRKEMVDSLCAKWNSMCHSSNDQNQLSSEQFRDLARTETDDELFKDCCTSAKKEGLTLSEFMARYV